MELQCLQPIKDDLKTYYGWSKIYQFDETETEAYEGIKEFLNQDSKFLDIIVDKSDFDEIFSLLEGKNERFLKHNFRDYLFVKIFKKAGGVEKYEQIEYWYEPMETYELAELLENLTKYHSKENFRLHIFLDDVTTELLQTKINDLFTYQNMTVIGYRSKDLLSYVDSKGNKLEALYDYIPESTNKCSKNSPERCRREK